MSSEQLADGVNPLDAELAATWDILKGYSGRDTDLGIARRFGGAAAAYSLRNIGSDGLPVVRVRRDSDDTEEDFSANQVASGALETFVIDGATQKGLDQSTWQNTGTESFSSTSIDGFSYSNSSGTAFIGVTLSETLALNDSVFISFNASGVTHPASSDQSPQVRLRDSISGGSGTSDINQVTNGFNAYTLTYDTGSSGQHIVFSEGDTAGGTVTISDFKVFGVSRNGFVETWYDQSGNGNDATQVSAGNQPAIVQNGGIIPEGIRFQTNDELETGGNITASTITGFVVANLKGTDANSLYSLGSDSVGSPNVLFGNPSLAYAINGGTALSGGTAPTFANTLFTQLFISGGTSKSFIDGSQIASGDAGSNTASSGKITIGNLASSTRYSNIAMNELIVFTSDKSTDQDEIEADISRNYNITLS